MEDEFDSFGGNHTGVFLQILTVCYLFWNCVNCVKTWNIWQTFNSSYISQGHSFLIWWIFSLEKLTLFHESTFLHFSFLCDLSNSFKTVDGKFWVIILKAFILPLSFNNKNATYINVHSFSMPTTNLNRNLK